MTTGCTMKTTCIQFQIEFITQPFIYLVLAAVHGSYGRSLGIARR